MSGLDNLIPACDLTPEERREIGRRGGIASGAARREKRRIIDMIDAFMERPSESNPGMSNEEAYLLAIVRRGLKYGNIDLMRLRAELRGELVQKNEIDLNGAIPTVLTDVVDFDDIPEEKPKKRGRRACKTKKSG
jgi:hypothetical protein